MIGQRFKRTIDRQFSSKDTLGYRTGGDLSNSASFTRVIVSVITRVITSNYDLTTDEKVCAIGGLSR